MIEGILKGVWELFDVFLIGIVIFKFVECFFRILVSIFLYVLIIYQSASFDVKSRSIEEVEGA